MRGQTNRPWLTAGGIATPIQHGPDKALKLDLYMPRHGNVRVAYRGLESDRSPPCDLSGKAVEPVIVKATAIPNAEPLALESRIRKVTGKTPLYRTSCTLKTASFQSPAVAFVQLEILPPAAETADAPATRKPKDRIRLEISKRTLNKDGKATLFWLLTDEQGNERLEAIAQRLGLFDRDDDPANEALAEIFCAIRSGADSPLLTEPLEEDDNDE